MAQYNINFSTNASQAAQEIDRVSRELTKVIKVGQSVKLNLDTSSLSATINTTFRKLNKEIENSQRKLSRLQIGGSNFNAIATRLGRAEGLRERGQLAAAPYRLRAQAEAFGPGSAISRSKVLEALQIQASQITPNTVEWVKFQQQIAQVNLEIKKTDKLAESIQLRENLGAFAPGSLAQLETRLTLIRNKAREITPNTTEWKQLNKEIQQLEGGIARANKKPLTAGQRAGAAGGAFLYGGGLGGGVGSAVGGIAGGLAGGVPGAFAGAAVGQAVDNLITYSAAIATTTAEVNKSKIALAGVTKNVNDYDFALKTATDAGDKFLIPITEAAKKFTRLQASVVGAGFDTQTTAKTFNAISAAIIATGGSAEDLNGALTATAQVFSKGKVTAEELRGQIGERLPGAFTIFAQSIGKTPQQLDKALEEGEVSLNDFIKFVEELGKRYSTTAEELANAPENAGARLKVALEAASASYGTFFQAAGAGFQNYATDLINFAIDNENTIKSVLASFVVLAEDLVSILSKVVETLAPVFGSFFGYIFENFAKGINAIATLAEESRRAAGGPEARAAKTIEQLYPNPVQRFIANANPFSQVRKDYEDALRVEKAYESKSSQIQGSRASRLKKYIEEFKPTKFGASLGQSTFQSSLGKDGAAKEKRKAKPQTYVSDLSKELQRELEQRTNAIRQDASLSDREREIQEAAMRYQYELLINKAEYNQGVEDENNKDILNRQGYLNDLKKTFDDENKLSQQAYEDVVTSPLREMLSEQRDTIIDLQAQEKMLAEGRTELTQVDKMQIGIKKALKGLDEEQLKKIQPLIDETLKEAAAIDILNASLGAQVALREALKPLQQELRLAQTLDPGLERRERIRQQNPKLDAQGVEQVAQLEEQVEAAKKAKEELQGIASTIGNAFGEAFKGIITGTTSVRDALSSLFSSIADAFADMVAKMIAEWLKAQLIKGFQALFNLALPGLGAAAGGIGGGLSSGFSAGTSSAIDTSAAGWGAAFNTNLQFANGGIAAGGFTAFANGGMVTGPTMGLVGEGRYNEAIVPLPDGKSIPVDLGGMAGGVGGEVTSNIVVNINNGQMQGNGNSNGSELGRKIEGAVKQVLVSELRPGGILSSGRR